VALPSLPGASMGAAINVTADGSVVVGYDRVGSLDQAFRWTAQTGAVYLGTLSAAAGSETGGISGDGSIIGGVAKGAFIWTLQSGMVDLKGVLVAHGVDLSGWFLQTANNISADGHTIVGDGRNPTGQAEAWLATLPSFVAGDVNLDGIVNGQDI